jgi:hypothetical protein
MVPSLDKLKEESNITHLRIYVFQMTLIDRTVGIMMWEIPRVTPAMMDTTKMDPNVTREKSISVNNTQTRIPVQNVSVPISYPRILPLPSLL